MKILCVDFDNPYGPTPGGQFQDTRQILFPLQRQHEIFVLTGGTVPKKQNLPVKYIGLPIGFGRQFDFIRQARHYVATHRDYDLIIEQFTSPIGPIGLPQMTDKPVIGIGGFLFWDEMSRKYHLPFGLVAQHLLQQYRYLICHNEEQAKRCRTINPQLMTFVRKPFVQGVELPATELGNSLLFIGRPDRHQKGLDLLAQILNKVNLPDARVVIAGGATKLDHYNGKLPLSFPGYLDDQQKNAAYKQARVLIMPSRYESFGLVQLEAAAHGVPTVAFDLSAFSDRRKAMRLVRPFDTKAFAEAIDELWNDPQKYSELRLASRVLASQHTNNQGADMLAQLIERIPNVSSPI